jgi:lycopene beta-cyclase
MRRTQSRCSIKEKRLAKGKKILLVDSVRKKQNDVPGVFGKTDPGPFEEIVFRRWEQAWFHSSGFSSLLNLSPYKYKMIRGIDFFNYCLEQISSSPEFEIITANVQSISNDRC